MSKTDNNSRPATLEDRRPLADSELDAVSGGVTVKQKVVDGPTPELRAIPR
jgi:hypothetical protein